MWRGIRFEERDKKGNKGSDNKFHHYSLVVDSIIGESFLYIDGIQQATLSSAITTTSAGTHTRFGRQFDILSEYFHGALDDVRIYDSALTGSQVAAVAGVVPIPPAFWLFGSGLMGLIGISRRKK